MKTIEYKPCGKCVSNDVCKYRNALHIARDILESAYERKIHEFDKETQEFLDKVTIELLCQCEYYNYR